MALTEKRCAKFALTADTDTWNYAAYYFWQKAGGIANQFDFVIGVSEYAASTEVLAFYSNSTAR